MTAQIISREIRRSFSLSAIRMLLLVIAVLALSSVVYLAQSTQATLTGQRVQTLNEQLTRYEREIDQLQYDIATLSTPARIAEIARSRGLHPASLTSTVYLRVKMPPALPTPAQSAANVTEPQDEPTLLTSVWNDFLDWLGLAGAHPAQAGQ